MNDLDQQTGSTQSIDRKSFIFGMITAFAECVAKLSYGVVWGGGADTVIAQIRETRETRATYARILLKPGTWPIENR